MSLLTHSIYIQFLQDMLCFDMLFYEKIARITTPSSCQNPRRKIFEGLDADKFLGAENEGEFSINKACFPMATWAMRF